MEINQLMDLVKDKNKLNESILADKVVFIKKERGVPALEVMSHDEWESFPSSEVVIAPSVFATYLKSYINDVISCEDFAICTIEVNQMSVAFRNFN